MNFNDRMTRHKILNGTNFKFEPFNVFKNSLTEYVE